MGFLSNRRRPETKTPTIEQVPFIRSLDESIAFATNPRQNAHATLHAAEAAANRLAEAVAEPPRLIVHPPLSHDVYTSYRTQLDLIIGMGQKIVAAQQAAEEVADAARAVPVEAPAPSYQGSGSSVKS